MPRTARSRTWDAPPVGDDVVRQDASSRTSTVCEVYDGVGLV